MLRKLTAKHDPVDMAFRRYYGRKSSDVIPAQLQLTPLIGSFIALGLRGLQKFAEYVGGGPTVDGVAVPHDVWIPVASRLVSVVHCYTERY